MNAAFFAAELSNLASESKRKNNELRNAAERALQDLKTLPANSEQQLAIDLSRRPAFIEPFLIACRTHNVKFAGSGIVCLQRLVISKGLPKSSLGDALEAFNTCSDLGLDIQLKILQALPSLVQNYASELENELLASTLQICSSLQAAKASTVSGVAHATLQQLVTTVFEKVVSEDTYSAEITATAQIPGEDGPIKLRPAAYDAYRVFHDLALAADDRKTTFVQFTSLSAESSLEIIWSCIDSNPDIFITHEELSAIIASNVFPVIIRALSERSSFSVTVRALRILDLILHRYIRQFPEDCEVALGLCNHALELDPSAPWKRAVVMEMLRNFFTASGHVVEAYAGFDSREGGKPVIQDIMSAFVRLSTEKPSVIGLGHQSSIPIGPTMKEVGVETVTLEAASMTGVFSSALGVAEANVPGISTQWSLPKSACIEQLDKNDPPLIPETYVYALVLDCLNGLSDGLARVVLPLTVPHEKHRHKPSVGSVDANSILDSNRPRTRSGKSDSFHTRAVPLNPLEAQDAPFYSRVKSVASLVESCWPAVLATSSTFLNAALDDQYFRNLIKSYQRFAQVAGLLRLEIPRDALMTTLSKASVPPHVLSATMNEPARTPTIESTRVFSNPKNLLSVDSFVSQTSTHSTEKDKRPSAEPTRPLLTVRNLLCLRALLNLAIALGPTLGSAFEVVISSLRHADLILSTTTPQQLTRQGSSLSQSRGDSPSVVQAFSAEIAAVEAAASRLLESTSDYPDHAFMNVLETFCRLLHGRADALPRSPKPDHQPPTPTTPLTPRRTVSGLPGIGNFFETQSRDYHFVIPKLGNLAELNVVRFVVDDPNVNGWNFLIDELSTIAKSNLVPREARHGATDVLVKLAGETIASVMKETKDDRAAVQRRSLVVLLRLVDEIYLEDGELTAMDLEVQGHVLDSLRAILERCGDSLVAGWNRIVAIISCAFEHEGSTARGSDDEKVHIDWNQISTEFVSSQIGRLAFAVTQLVCSDFLDSIPRSVVPSLIELLHRFMAQGEDLNTSLTTVTMVWNVSDFLLHAFDQDSLSAFVDEARDFDDLENDLQPLLRDSSPAQWLLLLIRLRDAAGQPLKEVRNAAFQTACNVFRSHGEKIPSSAWDLLLRITVFKISFDDAMLYRQEEEEYEEEQGNDDSEKKKKKNNNNAASPDVDMSKAIINGIAEVIAQNIQTIQQISRLPGLWEVFLGMLERYIDIGDNDLNAAVFTALSRVLSRIDPSSTAWKGPIYRTVALWLKRPPIVTEPTENKSDAQNAYLAYADAGEEVYRLTGDVMSTSQTRSMIDNLYTCIRDSDGPLYGADVNNMSPLQAKVMQLLKGIRADQPNIPACLITVAAKMAALHHEMTDGTVSGKTPTFVAIASDCVNWLQDLVQMNVSDSENYDIDSISLAIFSLKKVIQAKYENRLKHKGTPLWRMATSTALVLADPVLKQIDNHSEDAEARAAIWSEFVGIAAGIIKAPKLHLVEDKSEIHEDQLFDMESYSSLQKILIPRLGDPGLPDHIRQEYARSLFEASIIHPTEVGEIPDLKGDALKGIEEIRRGRVKQVPYSLREDMAYVCCKELYSLTSGAHQSPFHQKLADAAAALLMLRLAIPIRAYIADQPLRGRRPQPLSELEELLFCFDCIKNLKLGLGSSGAASREGVRAGEQEYLRCLYPLLVKAVRTAGDEWSGTGEVLQPLQGVLAAIFSESMMLK